MSEKSYIVTQGEYSDYHIVAVFLTRADAERYTDGGAGTEEHGAPNIEEWEVGPPDPTKWWQRVYYHCLKPDGNDYHVSMRWEEVERDYTKVSTVPDQVNGAYKWYYCAQAHSTVSAEHAKKLAVEARQAWIVRNPQ